MNVGANANANTNENMNAKPSASPLPRTNRARVWWAITAMLLLAAAIGLCIALGWGAAGITLLFAVLPDAALIGAFAEQGRLKPSRVRFYNLMHAPILAIALAAAGAIPLLLPARPWGLALAGLAWTAHIAADRAFGYGLRAPDGSIVPVGSAPGRSEA
jgi:hypothetical protein